MYRMLTEYGDKVPGCDSTTHDSIKAVINVVDPLVDISNGTPEKGCENISSATHRHLEELLNVVRLFTEWKNEAGKNKQHFIPVSTYEDLCWVCFSIIGIAKTHLPVGRAMVHKRLGSDVCEKTFGKSRGKNANGTAQDYRGILGHIQAAGTNSFANHSKTNAGGDTSMRQSEVMAPVPKRPKINAKKP